MAGKKSNDEKAAEIVAEAIRDGFMPPISGERGQLDNNSIEIFARIYSELHSITDVLEAATARGPHGEPQTVCSVMTFQRLQLARATARNGASVASSWGVPSRRAETEHRGPWGAALVRFETREDTLALDAP
jgi:hypothetical protein